jgi:hypothetical protein
MTKYTFIGKKATIEYEVVSYGINIGYEEGIKLLNPDIEWFTSCETDYQGSMWHIGIDKDKNFYYASDSYGSCSGCDWVQSINTQEGAIEFLKSREAICFLGKDVSYVKEYLRKEVESSFNLKDNNYKELCEWVDSHSR